eukprot:7371572-Alexandrium_andersonii.AAC.1
MALYPLTSQSFAIKFDLGRAIGPTSGRPEDQRVWAVQGLAPHQEQAVGEQVQGLAQLPEVRRPPGLHRF